MDSLAEVIEKQSQIIQMQSGIIDKLAACLLMHIEADEMPCLPEIRQAAELIGDLETE